MECVLSETNRKLTAENEELKKEINRWEKECIAERAAYNKVRDSEKEWFDKYELIMCNLAGKPILSVNESGFYNFESCLTWFIEEFKKLKGSAKC